MCLMLAGLRGLPAIEEAQVSAILARNPHGIGIAYARHGRLHVARCSDADSEQVLGLLAQIPCGVPFLVHFRDATVGAIDTHNIQPFEVHADEVVFGHNGTLKGYGCSRVSDTRHFAAATVATVLERFEGDVFASYAALSSHRPPGNRFVLLSARGQLSIHGEEEGFWCGEMWVSNARCRDIFEPSEAAVAA
ncbi:class II glutamine amidotransferase [Niveibacterium sp. SC-1]|uniref:class II glutamine amidotransferase n=1 Tax=Niveibacterium sp. SC-1 TaxID=3135646 RepID=UPI00311F3AAF